MIIQIKIIFNPTLRNGMFSSTVIYTFTRPLSSHEQLFSYAESFVSRTHQVMKHFTFEYTLQKQWHTDRVLVFQETTYLIIFQVNERILWTLPLMSDDTLYYGLLQFHL